ncbi:MAG: PAS domain-containing sensor histidine kinase [Campylobacterota bacterium]
MIKSIFISLFLSASLFASGFIDHIQDIDSNHLLEFILLLFFIFTSLFLLLHYILKRKNIELEAKLIEVVGDLEKAQSIAKIGSWVYDLKNNKLRWSKETYLMFEVAIDDDANLYEKFIERVHPEDRQMLEEVYGQSLKNGEGYSLEHRLLMSDGSIKHVLEKCESSFEEDGTPIVSHGTVQDITEATLIKLELQEKDAYMLQQSRLAMMGEMLSMIAHQWRQPLASIAANNISIKTSLELEQYDLKDDKEREDFLNYLNTKMDKTTLYLQELSQTINNFSNFYKPDKKFHMAEISEVFLKTYNLVFESLDSYNIKVDFDLESNYEFMMHENEFMQVILNIINNAKDQFLDKDIKDPVINISTHVKNDVLYIEISDNAGGIEEANLHRVFDPYFSTKLEKNGTGLGLYMSKVIIKDYHNGDIYAKNSDNGAIFTIKIKKVQDEKVQNAQS